MNFGTVEMGIPHQFLYVVEGIACCLPRSESRCSDINGIRAMVDGGHASREILGGQQKLNLTHQQNVSLSTGTVQPARRKNKSRCRSPRKCKLHHAR